MSYHPNLNEPRVQQRIKTAIGFTNACFSATKPRGWSTRYIDKHFGQQQNNLSKWLRTKLLICTDDRYIKGEDICKKYIKNVEGMDELVTLLSNIISYPSVLQVNPKKINVDKLTTDFVNEEFKQELTTKQFTYKDKSNRLWHDLQRVRKNYKKDVFSQNGLNHQYDIECCAPTLIYQYSQMIPELIHNGVYIQGPNEEYLPALTNYLADRNKIRHEVAIDADIPLDIAKEIINALLMGAQLGMNYKSDIYKLLNGDKARIEFLKQHEYITQLRSDIKTCWDYIKPTLPIITKKDKNNKERRRPVSSKQKSGVYFDLERKVLNASRDYLDMTNNKYFLEHDGFVCEKEVNREELSKWIYNKTGFNIKLQHEVL